MAGLFLAGPHPEAVLEPTLTQFVIIHVGVIIWGWLWIKDTPVTQEIPRVFRALCQELGTKTESIFYSTTPGQPEAASPPLVPPAGCALFKNTPLL